jgi:hypothetical protein
MIDYQRSRYLISARHIFNQEDLTKEVSFHFNYRNEWVPVKHIPILCDNPEVDIIAFYIDDKVNDEKNIRLCGDGKENNVILSEDVYICGFPYVLKLDIENLTNGFPGPLLKKGIVSGVLGKGSNHHYYLDIYNNKGFSGGPAVVNRNPKYPIVFGIVRGYQAETQPVYSIHSDNESVVNNAFTVQSNTGLTLVTPISIILPFLIKPTK